MTTYTVYHGDCLVALRMMADDSIDAIVTDPPYGLAFMGKRWDYDVPGVDVWREALRVLKPGGHLLAFGGTRTYHRMAVAIEDAGFEIRDQVQWVYGSGFPKSHDVSKAIDAAAGAEREVVGLSPYSANRYAGSWQQGDNRSGMARGDEGERIVTAPATPDAERWRGWGTAVKPSNEPVVIAYKPLDAIRERDIIITNLYALEAKIWLLSYAITAGRNSLSNQSECGEAFAIAQWNAAAAINTLDALSVRTDMPQLRLAVNTCLNIVSSWRIIWEESLNVMNTFTTSTESRQIIDLRTCRFYLSELTPLSIIQAETTQRGSLLSALPAARYFNAAALKLKAIQELFAVENAIAEGRIPRPDAIDNSVLNEPICMARKPLQGTVAANVLAWGTGAINVDGCRVGTNGETPTGSGDRRSSAVYAQDTWTKTKMANGGNVTPEAGRWPANFIHDGSDEVVGLFPVSVARPVKPENIGKSGDGSNRGLFKMGSIVQTGYYDTETSAARFFYCAKASKAERDAGLDGLELRTNDFHRASSGLNQDRPGREGRTPNTDGARNHHPTVKPVALMRYLCRLITPPGGTVLDPFCGSGTTGIGATLEGFNFVGIEQDAEYVEIAKLRIGNAVAEQAFGLFAEAAD